MGEDLLCCRTDDLQNPSIDPQFVVTNADSRPTQQGKLFEWHSTKPARRSEQDTDGASQSDVRAKHKQSSKAQPSTWVNPGTQSSDAAEAPAFSTWVNPSIAKPRAPRQFASLPASSKLFHPPKSDQRPVRNFVLKSTPVVNLPNKQPEPEVQPQEPLVSNKKTVAKKSKPIPKSRGAFAALDLVCSILCCIR